MCRCRIAPDPHVAVGLAVQRAKDRPPYSVAELEIASRLGHHAEKSLRLSIRLFDADLAKFSLGEALGRLSIGVFALDSLKRVVFGNSAGQRLLGDGLAPADDRLLIGGPEDRCAIEATIDQMIRAVPAELSRTPKPTLVQRRRSNRPLAIYVLPVTSAMRTTTEFLTHTRAIVLVIDPGNNEPADPAIVRDALGLTLGEARLAALIGSGLPPRQAAQKLSITEETARTTLKRVFSKIGVSRQSELAALLTRLVLR